MLCPQTDPSSYPAYFKELRYPLLCSPKYDGIRCITIGGTAYSRKLKPLPSRQVQHEFGWMGYLDGELLAGTYNETQSLVMSRDKEGDISFYVFDCVHPDFVGRPYFERLARLENLPGKVTAVPQEWVDNEKALLRYEERILSEGYEGIIMRDPAAPYKQGRGTWKEGIIYKLKRFQDDEGVILDVEEQMTNENEMRLDALGYAERSSSKEGLVGAATLGAFVVLFRGNEIRVAPGALDHEERRRVWLNKELYIGQELKFRYFDYGSKDAPRFARAVGFRITEMD